MKHSIIKLIVFFALCFGTSGMTIPNTASARPLQVNAGVRVNLGTPHHYYHRRRRRAVVVAAPVIVHRYNGHRNNGNRGMHKGNDKH